MAGKKKGGKKELMEKLESMHKESVKHGITADQFRKVFYSDIQKKHSEIRKSRFTRYKKYIAGAALVVLLAVYLCHLYELRSVDDIKEAILNARCVIPNNELVIEMCRPKVNCDMCKNLRQVPIETNISQEMFQALYAYSAVPVLVKNATNDWTAMSTFSFQYFKDLYNSTDGAIKYVEDECQFFPYKTGFETLGEVFNMSDDRANFKEGEENWYIGWSNCHSGIQKQLREHYQKPYFLPNNSESSMLDWMFMGGSGPGAFIHIDFVGRPSWQAQITGKKTWQLIPSPECENVCHELNVTVHKGDIVVVDTNKWFHSTFIHPGEISITIGSEYD